MIARFAGLGLALLVLVGCTRESGKGGPGANPPPKENPSKDDSFTVTVPSGATNITQGKREEITVSIDRGSKFTQDVKIAFDSSKAKGVKAVPAEATIKTGDSKTNVFIEAADDAPVGKHTITVTGTPATGKAASVNMDIDVKAKN